ncbi:hypothetical protein B0H13DRAFT_1850539 [Mycena leptocephala]|nr:hypothetical protein B0H13DRAFT_1850539 [Mycena leptocephala]
MILHYFLMSVRSKKIPLFPEREEVLNTPPSLIIPDNDADLGLLLKQCAGLIQEEALYERVRDAITSLGDIDWAVSPERQRAALKKIDDNQRRRKLIDVRCRAEWQEHIRLESASLPTMAAGFHYYVCIRLSLETTWNCPTCDMRMTTPPTAQTTGDDSIAVQFPDWDESRIVLHWDGLVFPRPKISLHD